MKTSTILRNPFRGCSCGREAAVCELPLAATFTRVAALILFLFAGLASLHAGEQTVTHRITGLFEPNREADLREVVGTLNGITVVSVDVPNSEATFRYDPAVAFKDTKPEKIVERLDNLLRAASHSTFGAKPLCPTPKDKLTRIELSVGGIDCRACSLACYEIVAKVEGVEAATASFHDGKVTALIDPAKTNREAIEQALKKREVDVKR